MYNIHFTVVEYCEPLLPFLVDRISTCVVADAGCQGYHEEAKSKGVVLVHACAQASGTLTQAPRYSLNLGKWMPDKPSSFVDGCNLAIGEL